MGGVSKASKTINLGEDIFEGYNSTLCDGNVTHHEYIQVGKGNDLGLNHITLFESKVANGNGEQAISRDLYRLGSRFHFYRMMSCYSSTIGFYSSSLLFSVAVKGLESNRLFQLRILRGVILVIFIIILIVFSIFRITLKDKLTCILAFMSTFRGLLMIAQMCKLYAWRYNISEFIRTLAKAAVHTIGFIIFFPVSVIDWFPFV